MVLGLARAGIHVVATAARERTEIEAVAEEVRQSCGESRVLPLVADVTQEDDCAEVVDAAVKRFGRLDILVNNAWSRPSGRPAAMISRPQKRRPNKQAGRLCRLVREKTERLSVIEKKILTNSFADVTFPKSC
jgi:NAD(P)-dependent dehydrogenase (short-subunit alcohol dehydrogenase family)